MKQDLEFEWNLQQNIAFMTFKNISAGGTILMYFDVSKPVTISCDGSKSGLGTVSLQDCKSIAYVSRSMADAQTRYTQIEKELRYS